MAILNICGFETGDLSELFSSAGTCSISSSTFRSGAYSFRSNPTTSGSGGGILKTLGTNGAQTNASVATSYSRFYFRYATKPSSAHEIFFGVETSGGTRKCTLRLNSAGNILFYDSSNLLGGTGATVLAANTWYRIEVKCGSQSAGSGVWEVKINGTSEISGAVATLNTTSAAYIRLGKYINANSQTVDFFYDDVSWSDSDYPGEGAIVAMLPNGAGTYQQWSTSDMMNMNHYQMVDEVPPNGDTDYCYNSTLMANNIETEALVNGTTAGVSGTVNVVKSLAIIKRQLTSGTTRVILRSGSTDDLVSADYSNTSSYVALSKLYPTDPATSAAWTVSGLDGVETGAKNTDANGSRMTFTCAMVDFTVSSQSPVPRCLTLYRRRRNKK